MNMTRMTISNMFVEAANLSVKERDVPSVMVPTIIYPQYGIEVVKH